MNVSSREVIHVWLPNSNYYQLQLNRHNGECKTYYNTFDYPIVLPQGSFIKHIDQCFSELLCPSTLVNSDIKVIVITKTTVEMVVGLSHLYGVMLG